MCYLYSGGTGTSHLNRNWMQLATSHLSCHSSLKMSIKYKGTDANVHKTCLDLLRMECCNLTDEWLVWWLVPWLEASPGDDGRLLTLSNVVSLSHLTRESRWGSDSAVHTLVLLVSSQTHSVGVQTQTRSDVWWDWRPDCALALCQQPPPPCMDGWCRQWMEVLLWLSVTAPSDPIILSNTDVPHAHAAFTPSPAGRSTPKPWALIWTSCNSWVIHDDN